MAPRFRTTRSRRRAAPGPRPSAIGLVLAATLFVACGTAAGGDGIALDAVEPAVVSARGGEILTLSGRGFRTGATVTLGTVDATVLEVTDTSIRAESPRLLAGLYDVTVRNTGGRSGTLSGGLTVAPLTLAFREAAAHYLPDLGDADITSVASADVDGDGDVDVVLGLANGPSRLLLNSGAGAFEDAGPADGGGGPALPPWDHDTRQVILTDLDGDGAPDLFVCNGSGEENRLLRNDGQGRFTDAPARALPRRVGSCLQATAADLDGDGRPDLAVVAGRAPLDATQLLRVYRNRSIPGVLELTLAEELETPAVVDGAAYGATYGSDAGYTVAFSTTTGTTATGRGAGLLAYDFVGVDGYVFYTLPVPGARWVPDGLRLQIYGDGNGHRLTLRLFDGADERFVKEIGPVDWAGWQTVEATGIAGWDHYGGNDDGVVDVPVTSVALQLDRVAGGADSGALRVDDVELWSDAHGVVLVEDFEGRAAQHQWLDVFTGLVAGDLDGDGRADLVLTATSSATGAFLRILRSDPAGGSDGPASLGLEVIAPEALAAPATPLAFAALLDLESDGDNDLVLLSAGQDIALVNDGTLHLFDDTETLLPVDRVDGQHAAVGDLDLDGRPDLVIANDGAANRLYLNGPTGRLRDETPALGLTQSPSRRVLIFDATGDGVPDVLVVNRAAPRLQLFVSVAEGGP